MNSNSLPPPESHAQVSARALRALGIVRWVLVALSLGAAVFAWSAYFSPAVSEGATARFQCPMHPQVTSSEPGECPICHMRLEPIPDSPAKPKPAPPRAPKPNASAAASEPSANDGESEIAGVGPVELDLARAQSIGMRTARALRGSADEVLRVTASVAATESSTAEVRVRAAGFVERVAVGESGGRVRAGQELLAVYSPEIYQALTDLVLAGSWADKDARSSEALAASSRRLELLGVSRAVLERALERREAPRNVPISAPLSGYVLSKNVTRGSYVTPDMVLYRLADLDRVFVLCDVPSSDVSRVARGQKARFVPAARPQVAVESTVELIYPEVNEAARTVRLRLSLDNRKLGLMPGEYGTVELSSAGSDAVWIPRDALVDTGLERYAFIESAPGHYQPRRVAVGRATPDRVEILRGVSAGETVVSGAVFLLDSESRLRAALRERPDANGP